MNINSFMKVSVRSLKNLEMLRLYLKRPHVIALHMLLDTCVTRPLWCVCCVYTMMYM